MTTKKRLQMHNFQNGQVPPIPLEQYMKFRNAKDRVEVADLNNQIIQEEMNAEKGIVKRLKKKKMLTPGNGLEFFISACERRLAIPWCFRVKDHSERVRRFSCCVAMDMDPELKRIIFKVSAYHDVGKTLIAQYLVNREDGSENGIGKGERITLDELFVLRHSHINVGISMVNLYAPFMSETEADHSLWIVGGHQIAHNGKGSSGGSGYYPSAIIEKGLEKDIVGERIPLAARIVRCADVYAAIMENRFYLEKSRRVMDMVRGMGEDDVALGLLITVAGVDVDPKLVRKLIMERYDLDKWDSDSIIESLKCTNRKILEERGGDITFSIEKVLPESMFQMMIASRNDIWDHPMDTGVLAFV